MCTIIPLQTQARTHIGDELPASKYQIGNGPPIDYEIEAEYGAVPMFYPEWAFDKLTWCGYPPSAYYFRSAPTEGANFFAGKISDAGACISNNIANLFFNLTKISTILGNSVLVTCFDDFVLQKSLTVVMKTVKDISPFSNNGAKTGIGFLFYLAMAGLGISVCILILRAQAMKALGSILLSILCFTGLMIYVGHIESIIPPAISCLNNFTGVAIMATSGLQDYVPEGSEEDITFNIETSDTSDISTLGLSMANLTNAVWFATVSAPWANGQLGTSDYRRLKMTESEKEKVNKALNRSGDTVRHKTLQSEYIDTNYLTSSEDVKEPLLAAITALDIDHGEHAITVSASGPGEQNAQRHITAAFWSMFPAGAFLVLMVLVGIPVFCSQILLIGLLIILPFALVIGIAGDRGRQVMLRCIQWTLQALSLKVIYGFYLGLIMMLAILMMKIAGNNAALSSFLLFTVFGAASYFRKPFFSLVMGLISFTPAKIDIDNPFKTFLKYSLLQKVLNRERNSQPPSVPPSPVPKNNNAEGEGGSSNESEPPKTPGRNTEEPGTGVYHNQQAEREYQEYLEREAKFHKAAKDSRPGDLHKNNEDFLSTHDNRDQESDAGEGSRSNEPSFQPESSRSNETTSYKSGSPNSSDSKATSSRPTTSKRTQQSNVGAETRGNKDTKQSDTNEPPQSKNNEGSGITTMKESAADYSNYNRTWDEEEESLWQRREQLRAQYFGDSEETGLRKRQSEDPPARWKNDDY